MLPSKRKISSKETNIRLAADGKEFEKSFYRVNRAAKRETLVARERERERQRAAENIPLGWSTGWLVDRRGITRCNGNQAQPLTADWYIRTIGRWKPLS